jgi:hypothetical protein
VSLNKDLRNVPIIATEHQCGEHIPQLGLRRGTFRSHDKEVRVFADFQTACRRPEPEGFRSAEGRKPEDIMN